MKKIVLPVLVFFFLLQSCNLREREDLLHKKEAELNEREQQLLLREQNLELREDELNKKQLSDSLAISDSTAKLSQSLVGSWLVEMTCTETTCTGSAVGDTKNEVWEVLYEDQKLVAKAMANNELVRVYTGQLKNNAIELQDVNSAGTPAVKIIVRLTMVKEGRLEGHREIERVNENCKIVYAMKMEKQ